MRMGAMAMGDVFGEMGSLGDLALFSPEEIPDLMERCARGAAEPRSLDEWIRAVEACVSCSDAQALGCLLDGAASLGSPSLEELCSGRRWPGAPSSRFEPALMLCVRVDVRSCFHLLVLRGAALDVRGPGGSTLAHQAYAVGSLWALRDLASAGAVFSAVDDLGRPPRSFADSTKWSAAELSSLDEELLSISERVALGSLAPAAAASRPASRI